MTKISSFIVKFRYWFLGLFTALTVLSGFFIPYVNINYDMTAYLPKDSDIVIGLNILDEEFSIKKSSTLKVMITGLNDSQKDDVYAILSNLNNGISVSYDKYSPTYNQGNNSLFIINVPESSYSLLASSTYKNVKSLLNDYPAYYSGDIVEARTDYLTMMVLVGGIILFIVLLILSKSWVEPLIFMVTIGMAVLLNMGTNIMFPSVSNITFTIASILQLVLSIDYSIILMNRYRQNKNGSSPIEAMKTAISQSGKTILSSSVTTIMGLLSLLFMSFSFGFDIGVVLAKGIFFSLLTTFMVLPALVIMCHRLIDKTKKRALEFKMGKIANFGYKTRRLVLFVFVVLFGASTYLNYQVPMMYYLDPSGQDYRIVESMFPTQSQIVVIYDNDDREVMVSFANDTLGHAKTLKIDSYETTIGAPMLAEELSQTVSIDSILIKSLMYLYHDGPLLDMSINQMANFIIENLATRSDFSDYLTSEVITQITQFEVFTNVEKLNTIYSVSEISALTGISTPQAYIITSMYYLSRSETIKSSISLLNFMSYAYSLSVNPTYASMFSDTEKEQLVQVKLLMDLGIANISYDVASMSDLLIELGDTFDASMVNIAFLLYSSNTNYDETWTISIDQLMTFLVEDFINDETYSSMLDSSYQTEIMANYELITYARDQFIGNEHSLMVITTSFVVPNDEAIAYVDALKVELSSRGIQCYMIGTIPVASEMKNGFRFDLNLITAISIVVIFIIVAMAFRSLFIPLLLVLFTQGAIFLTLSISTISGTPIYFLAIIIVQAILMGSAIDYSIVYTSYYREQRPKLSILNAMKVAYKGSIETITTSSILLVSVATVVGFISTDPVISSVVLTLAKGMAIAMVLTIFLLPPIVALFDKLVCHKLVVVRNGNLQNDENDSKSRK